MDKKEAIEIVGSLRKNTQEYKKLLITSKHPTMSKIMKNHEEIEELRCKLNADYYLAKKFVTELGEKPRFTHGIHDEEFCAYEAAYEDTQGKLFKVLPALDLCVKDLLKVRKSIVMISEKSFELHFGDKNHVVQKQEMSFEWLKFLLAPFKWMFNFVLKYQVTCIVMSLVILVFVEIVLN